jgi:hypothetical protein
MRAAPAGGGWLEMKKMTMTRASLAALGFVCAGALGAEVLSPRPATAAADEPYEILRGMFASYDYNRDGRITAREFNAFRVLVFVSMDADADGRVSLDEFMAWDPGFAQLAAAGKGAAVQRRQARRVQGVGS